jgi:DNA-binding transcriptional regulator YdaS (Cro superfamily)
MIIPRNKVKIAVKKAGGPTKVSNLLGVSNGSVHSWMKQGRVSNIDKAKLLAELAGMQVEDVRSWS